MNERLGPWTKAEDYVHPPRSDMDALRIENPIAAGLIGEIQHARSYEDLRDIEQKAFNMRASRTKDTREAISEEEWKSIMLEVERHVLLKISDAARDATSAESLNAEFQHVVYLFTPHSRIAVKAMRIVEDAVKTLGLK